MIRSKTSLSAIIVLFSKINPSFFTIKEGSTFLTKPLFPQGREDVTTLRCSEPLRFMVGGPSKVYAMFCGMGPPYYSPLYITNTASPKYYKQVQQSVLKKVILYRFVEDKLHSELERQLSLRSFALSLG